MRMMCLPLFHQLAYKLGLIFSHGMLLAFRFIFDKVKKIPSLL